MDKFDEPVFDERWHKDHERQREDNEREKDARPTKAYEHSGVCIGPRGERPEQR
jgi:hypothetical protein